jgi:DNA-binding beta-propeller fold protein YncE
MRLHLSSLALLVGCTAYYTYEDNGGIGALDTGGVAVDDTGRAPADDDGETDYEAETEQDFLMLAPATTDTFVFVANPDRDTVTRVAVPSLEVLTMAVGDRPELAMTTPDHSLALVFNQGSDDLSVIEARTLDQVLVPLRSRLNAMELSPDGRWALVYRDADIEEDEQDEQDEQDEAIESYHEISLVDTASHEHWPMVVGFAPHQVRFTDQSDLAMVVGDAWLAIIDLEASTPEPVLVQLSDDLVEPPDAEELEIAPDGSFAFIRQFGADEVLVLDLASFALERVPVGDNPTDLDILPDGSKAAVVCRGSQELWLLDASDPGNPSLAERLHLPPDQVLGSLLLSPDGSLGLLYTTALLQDRFVTWDIDAGSFETRGLVKPVANMSVSPNGDSLLVFHTKEDAEDADPSGPFYDRWAISLMDLEDFRTNPLRLAAEPTAYAHADDGAHGYFIMEDQPWLEVLDYATLLPEDIELKSTPIHLGVLPGTDWAYASQEHDLGRISFYDSDSDALETITGFELNGEIEH